MTTHVPSWRTKNGRIVFGYITDLTTDDLADVIEEIKYQLTLKGRKKHLREILAHLRLEYSTRDGID